MLCFNFYVFCSIELEGESSEAKDLHNVLPEELETICQKLRHVYQSMVSQAGVLDNGKNTPYNLWESFKTNLCVCVCVCLMCT